MWVEDEEMPFPLLLMWLHLVLVFPAQVGCVISV